MSSRRIWSVLALLCRLVLAAVFLRACVVKIADPAAFALAVSRYHILPAPLINLAAMVLPWVELLTGACLLLPARSRVLLRLRLASLLLIAGMLLVFIVAIGYLLSQGQTASCGCFSMRADAASSNILNIVRNIVLVALAAGAFLSDLLPPSEPSSASAP